MIEADVVSLDVATDQLTVTRPEPLITIIREAHRLAAATTAEIARDSQAALEELEARLDAARRAAEQDR